MDHLAAQGHHMGLSKPELLRYLHGEITFETWLLNQDKQQLRRAPHNPLIESVRDAMRILPPDENLNYSLNNTDGETEAEQTELETEDEEQKQASIVPTTKTTTSEEILCVLHDPLRHVSFDNVPPYNAEEKLTVQGEELVPIMKILPEIIKASTVPSSETKKSRRMKKAAETDDIIKDLQSFQFRKSVTPKWTRKVPDIPRLQLGQANMLVAKGDFKQAAEICMEVVKEVPSYGEAFKTLSFIYEEQGNMQIALQYELVAAFLDCKNPQEWKDLANKCLNSGSRSQAIACYDRACKVLPRNVCLQWDRAALSFEVQDYRKVVDVISIILKVIQPEEGLHGEFLNCAKTVATMFYRTRSWKTTRDILEPAVYYCKNVQDYEAINMLCETYVKLSKPINVIKVLCERCNVTLPPSVFENERRRKKIENKCLRTMQKVMTDEQLPSRVMHHLEKTSLEQIIEDPNIVFQETEETKEMPPPTTTELPGSHTPPAPFHTPLAPLQTPSDTPLQTPSHTPLQTPSDTSLQTPSDTFHPPSTTPLKPPSSSECWAPDDLPIDLRVKLAQSLLQIGEPTSAEMIAKQLLATDLEKNGDLVFDLAETYFELENFQFALNYLLELVECPKYNQAAVWLKIAESFSMLGENEKAINAYYMVLSLAPQHVSARMCLATLLRGNQRHDEALTVISEYDDVHNVENTDQSSGSMVHELHKFKAEEYPQLYKKCMALHAEGKYTEFLCDGYIFIHNYLLWNPSFQRKLTVGRAQMWQFLLRFLEVATELNEFEKAFKILGRALQFKHYQESKKHRLELDYLLTTISFVAREYTRAFDAFRVLVAHETQEITDSNNSLWNLFSLITSKMLDKRHHRYVLRLLFRKPKTIPLVMMNGHHSFISGTYKYAIGEYVRCFRAWPHLPLVSLMLGVSFLHLSCQKFHQTRHTSILQGFVFMLQYVALRNEDQEAVYNMGRAFHQIGLLQLAAHYYNKALEFPLADADSDEYNSYSDLHREAACNLAHIYKGSGNFQLSTSLLRKYCWV